MRKHQKIIGGTKARPDPKLAVPGTHIFSVKEQTFEQVLCSFYAGTIRVKVLAPVPTADLTPEDVTKLSIDTRETMLKVFYEMDTEQNHQVTDKAKIE